MRSHIAPPNWNTLCGEHPGKVLAMGEIAYDFCSLDEHLDDPTKWCKECVEELKVPSLPKAHFASPQWPTMCGLLSAEIISSDHITYDPEDNVTEHFNDSVSWCHQCLYELKKSIENIEGSINLSKNPIWNFCTKHLK